MLSSSSNGHFTFRFNYLETVDLQTIHPSGSVLQPLYLPFLHYSMTFYPSIPHNSIIIPLWGMIGSLEERFYPSIPLFLSLCCDCSRSVEQGVTRRRQRGSFKGPFTVQEGWKTQCRMETLRNMSKWRLANNRYSLNAHTRPCALLTDVCMCEVHSLYAYLLVNEWTHHTQQTCCTEMVSQWELAVVCTNSSASLYTAMHFFCSHARLQSGGYH